MDFELFVQGFLKDEQKVCPECGGREVEQRFTGFLTGSRGGEGGSSTGCGHQGGFG
jgi:hypothetical protein